MVPEPVTCRISGRTCWSVDSLYRTSDTIKVTLALVVPPEPVLHHISGKSEHLRLVSPHRLGTPGQRLPYHKQGKNGHHQVMASHNAGRLDLTYLPSIANLFIKILV